MLLLPNFDAPRLGEEIASGLYVEEDHFRRAKLSDLAPGTQPYLVTYGVKICKAIAMHNRNKGIGVLAHLGYVTDLEAGLQNILDGAESRIDELDIRIVQARQISHDRHWPPMDDIADFYESLGPRSFAVDYNTGMQRTRNIALHLETGRISDVYDKGFWYIKNDPEWRLEQMPIKAK